jgi:preprotein translocase subunit YajC
MQTFLILFQGGGLSGLTQLMPLVLIIAVFYVLVIRPQQKRQRQLQETISSLRIKDKVVTTGGVIGVITEVRDASFIIRSADKTILEVARSSIADIDRDGKEAS